MLTAETCLLVSFRKACKHLGATRVADSVCSNLFSKHKAFPDCSIPATPQKYLTLDTHLRRPRGPLLRANGDFIVQADVAPLPLTSCCGFSLGQLLTAVSKLQISCALLSVRSHPRSPRPWLCTPCLLGRVERVGGWGWSVPGAASCMSSLGSSPFLGTWERRRGPHRAGSAGLSRVQTSFQCLSSWWGCSDSSPFLVLSSLRCLTGSGVCEAGFPASSRLPCLRGSGD